MRCISGIKSHFVSSRGRSFRACITFLDPVHEGFYGVTDNEEGMVLGEGHKAQGNWIWLSKGREDSYPDLEWQQGIDAVNFWQHMWRGTESWISTHVWAERFLIIKESLPTVE